MDDLWELPQFLFENQLGEARYACSFCGVGDSVQFTIDDQRVEPTPPRGRGVLKVESSFRMTSKSARPTAESARLAIHWTTTIRRTLPFATSGGDRVASSFSCRPRRISRWPRDRLARVAHPCVKYLCASVMTAYLVLASRDSFVIQDALGYFTHGSGPSSLTPNIPVGSGKS